MSHHADAEPWPAPTSVLLSDRIHPVYRRALWHGMIIAGLFFLVYIFVVVAPREGIFGMDAWAYWNVDLPGVYDVPLSGLGSFPYSPPAALLADTFDSVSWTTFIWLWTALLVGTLVFLGGSGAWILAAFAFPPVALELLYGNIHILLAVAVALGFRYPWTWTFVLLTKPTCAVGLLWFVLRREWRQLAVATLPALVICAATFILAPSLWRDWITFLLESPQVLNERGSIPIPLMPRLVVSVVLVTWGALTNRRWVVVVAATLALPVLWVAGLSMLVGVIPELRARFETRRAPGPVAAPGPPLVAAAQ